MSNYHNCTKEVRKTLKQIINDKFPGNFYYKIRIKEDGSLTEEIPDNIIFKGSYYACLKSYSKIYQKFSMEDYKFNYKAKEYMEIRPCDLITSYFREYCNHSYMENDNQKIAEVMAKHIIEDDLLIKVDI